ncbi:hypothetical protein HK096_006687 [Nowakowskiella sp. JEL0078]|nr:hypothetical protein HK096_006687 [Nowakowskiella sp. JEL0078]
MLVYIWSRRNPQVRMEFLGLFNFHAPYLPWVLLAFTVLLNSIWPTADLLGMFCGHVYYFFEDVYPNIPPAERRSRIFEAPLFVKTWFDSITRDPNDASWRTETLEAVANPVPVEENVVGGENIIEDDLNHQQ